MATLKTTSINHWTNATIETNVAAKQAESIWSKYLAFTDRQQKNRTLWFLIILSVHAAAFLPVPIMLVSLFNAPMAVLGITMVSFFANFVANMGGSNTRLTISLFLLSILIHASMIIVALAM